MGASGPRPCWPGGPLQHRGQRPRSAPRTAARPRALLASPYKGTPQTCPCGTPRLSGPLPGSTIALPGPCQDALLTRQVLVRDPTIAPPGPCEDPLLPHKVLLLPCQVPARIYYCHVLVRDLAIAPPGPCEDPLLPHQVPAVSPPALPACCEALLLPCQNPRLLQNYFCGATASVTGLLGSKQPSLMASCTHTRR